MCIWFDSLTPKQLLLCYKLSLKIKELGFKVYITSRSYDYIESLISLYKMRNTYVIGRYGETLEDKLLADINRMSKLIDIVKKWKPKVLISYPSPSGFRVAYGLSIPIVAITDSPHSRILNKLTLPLASVVIVPKAIGRKSIDEFLSQDINVLEYNGVDEVEFLKDFRPDPNVPKSLGLNVNETFFIVRPPEEKASYYKFEIQNYDEIIEYMLELGKIVYFPRYEYQKAHVIQKFKDKIIIPREAVDVRSLSYYATAVVSGGSTMSREAALLGTPSIYTFPLKLEVNEWLKNIGFPIYHAPTIDSTLKVINRVLKEDRNSLKAKAIRKLKSIEGPMSTVLESLKLINVL